MTFQNQGGYQQPSGGFGQPAGGQGVALPGADTRVQGAFLTQAFFWMFAGLLLTAAVAAYVQFNDGLIGFVGRNFLIVILAQLGLAIGIQALIGRISATIALGLFFIYAGSIGLTVGLIVSFYTATSVATAFLSAGAMFGGAALYGYTTKRSLAGIGGFAAMGAFGLFAALIVNFFLGSSTFGYILSAIGVVIFTVLTAWDVQRISSGQLVQQLGSVEKAAVIGALHLYLDFINLFLFLLRLFGSRR